MKTNYLMSAEDVANELGVSKGHAYKVIRQLNDELEKSGFIVVTGKIPRAFWEKKFYGYQTAKRRERKMPAYKDEKRNTWLSLFYYEDWQGNKKKKQKRGFKTKKEALEWENYFKLSANANMDMTMGAFVEIYFRDKEGELKERSIKNKRYMIEAHILPHFQNKKMNEITPSDII